MILVDLVVVIILSLILPRYLPFMLIIIFA